MKRIFSVILLVAAALVLSIVMTACTQKAGVTFKTTEGPTISTTDADKTLFHYQGKVVFDVTDVEGIESIVLKDIKFAENKNGFATIHKAGADHFTPIDVKEIKKELSGGVKYDKLTFSGIDIKKSATGKTATITMQYLILEVGTDVKKEDIKRKVILTLQCFNSNGGKLVSQPAEITVP